MSDLMTAKAGVFEHIHGTGVWDPFRWLEDRSCAETEDWVKRQDEVLRDYFGGSKSYAQLSCRVRSHLDVEMIDGLGRIGDKYFYRKRRLGEEQASIFVRDPLLGERCLVDLAIEGPYTSVDIHQISRDAEYLAYEVKRGGDQRKAIRVLAVGSGGSLSDGLETGLACGFSFSKRNGGFYYCHEYGSCGSGMPHQILFHRMGTLSSDDVCLFSLERLPGSKLLFRCEGEVLTAAYCHQDSGAPTMDYYLADESSPTCWRKVLVDAPMPLVPFLWCEKLFAYELGKRGNGQISELDRASGNRLRVVVPESDQPVGRFVRSGGRLYVSYARDTGVEINSWAIDGSYIGRLPLNEECTWRVISPYSDDTEEIFIQGESFSMPRTLYVYAPSTNNVSLWRYASSRNVPAPTQFKRISYKSTDGIDISMCLVGSDDCHVPRRRPMIMTAYGGFGVTLTPQFSIFVTVLLELGCILAIPSIRGGGGYGSAWHLAAKGRMRQVAFDDFLAAAEWLCDRGFTEPSKLAIFGGSNSGTLVGAAITQRPDLFGAAICIAPLLDMLRFHLFDNAAAWKDEFGDINDEKDFRALLAYSPYHRVEPSVDYPSILFVTGDRDSRCNPSHVRKMAARLATRSAQTRPILVDHTSERGHSPAMPLSVRTEALTRRIDFVCRELMVKVPKGGGHEKSDC